MENVKKVLLLVAVLSLGIGIFKLFNSKEFRNTEDETPSVFLQFLKDEIKKNDFYYIIVFPGSKCHSCLYFNRFVLNYILNKNKIDDFYIVVEDSNKDLLDGLSLKENQFAFFNNNLLHKYGIYDTLPILYRVTKDKIKVDLLSDMNVALILENL